MGVDRRKDSFLFRRDFGGNTAIVSAVYIPGQSVWSLLVKLNGEAVDSRQSDNPWHEAQAMIDAALLDIGEPVVVAFPA